MSQKTAKMVSSIILVLGIIIFLWSGGTYLANQPPLTQSYRPPKNLTESFQQFGQGMGDLLTEVSEKGPKRKKAEKGMIIGVIIILVGGLSRAYPDEISKFFGGEEWKQ